MAHSLRIEYTGACYHAYPLAAAQEQCLLGSEGWIEQIRREYLLVRAPDNREDLALRRIQRSVDLGSTTPSPSPLVP